MLFGKLFSKSKKEAHGVTANTAAHINVGIRGEDAACDFLNKNKLSIIARNFRAGKCEIDIIAEDRRNIVFVEVKTRTSPKGSPYGRPSDAVNRAKRENVISAAREFLRRYAKNDKRAIRFDVIEIYATASNEISEIIHIKDAFSAY